MSVKEGGDVRERGGRDNARGRRAPGWRAQDPR
jgi:hypothetical protein